MKAEDTFNKPPTGRQQKVLSQLVEKPDCEIDYSEVPPLTEDQLAAAFRPRDKQLIAVRLDRDVLTWLKSYGQGYSTRINGILRAVMLNQRTGV